MKYLGTISDDKDLVTKEYVDDAISIAGGAVPATATPIMDGTGAVGTSTKYAREDHVHPSDTTKADISSTVSNVAYDSTNAKITETINGNTSDVVTVATLSVALGIGDKLNKTNGEETSDLNNCKTAGFYTFTKDASNIPFTSGGGVGGSLLVMRFSSTYIYQVAFANNNSTTSTAAQLRIYARRYYNGTWYEWYKFTLS